MFARSQRSPVTSELVLTDRAAQIMGVSRLRVLQMIEAGQLPAAQASGRYLLRTEALQPRKAPGRPLTHDAAWDVLHLAAGVVPTGLTPRTLSQRRRELDRIAADEDPALRARTLLSARAQRRFFASVDPSTLLEDDRVVASGAWHPASGISTVTPAAELDHLRVYVHADDLEDVRALHMLSDDVTYGAVIIACVTTRMPKPEIMPAVVAADLAESIHPREQQMSRNFWVHASMSAEG